MPVNRELLFTRDVNSEREGFILTNLNRIESDSVSKDTISIQSNQVILPNLK